MIIYPPLSIVIIFIQMPLLKGGLRSLNRTLLELQKTLEKQNAFLCPEA